MLCSTIIPTIGRSSLQRAVESVLSQSLPGEEFEVLVINDSGSPLLEGEWQRSEKVKVINTNRRERSVARNTGAAVARGTYLHFLDDDDWLNEGAYQHLRNLSRTSDAKWLYGKTQLVDRQDRLLIQLRHSLQGNAFVQAMSGEWIPLQSSWIERKTFLRIGGFNPLLTGPEDVDLLRRMLLEDELAETPYVISHIRMGTEGSTTDYVHHSQASRWAREQILNLSGAYARMKASASGPLWKGRMLRIYLTSVVWNVQERRFFTAYSRLFHSFTSVLHAPTSLLSGSFWSAARNPYASLTFERGFQEVREAKQLE